MTRVCHVAEHVRDTRKPLALAPQRVETDRAEESIRVAVATFHQRVERVLATRIAR